MHWVAKKELRGSSLAIQVSQHRKVPSRRIVGGRRRKWEERDGGEVVAIVSHRKLGCLVCVFRRSHHD